MFQPPFQSGRTSPDASQSRTDLPPMPAVSPDSLGCRDEAASGGASSDPEPEIECQQQDKEEEEQQQQAEESAQASAPPPAELGSSLSSSSSQTSLSTTRTADSGFFEAPSSASCCSLDPHAEKETSCEKAVRPEGNGAGSDSGCWLFPLSPALIAPPYLSPAAAVTGYQQPSEAAAVHGSQFYISLLDPGNKEQRLDEKGAHFQLKELIS